MRDASIPPEEVDSTELGNDREHTPNLGPSERSQSTFIPIPSEAPLPGQMVYELYPRATNQPYVADNPRGGSSARRAEDSIEDDDEAEYTEDEEDEEIYPAHDNTTRPPRVPMLATPVIEDPLEASSVGALPQAPLRPPLLPGTQPPVMIRRESGGRAEGVQYPQSHQQKHPPSLDQYYRNPSTNRAPSAAGPRSIVSHASTPSRARYYGRIENPPIMLFHPDRAHLEGDNAPPVPLRAEKLPKKHSQKFNVRSQGPRPAVAKQDQPDRHDPGLAPINKDSLPVRQYRRRRQQQQQQQQQQDPSQQQHAWYPPPLEFLPPPQAMGPMATAPAAGPSSAPPPHAVPVQYPMSHKQRSYDNDSEPSEGSSDDEQPLNKPISGAKEYDPYHPWPEHGPVPYYEQGGPFEHAMPYGYIDRRYIAGAAPAPPQKGFYVPPPAVGPAAPEDHQTQAELHIIGNLRQLTRDWTEQETRLGRRLVAFTRVQHGVRVDLHFQTIDPKYYNSSMCAISCILRKNTDEYFVTSVDCITLLELIIDQKFSVEEKNRIRRNLEVCRPITVSKSKPGLEDFFRQIMSYGAPRPRNIEKDVKVFLWENLESALKKIVAKYSASWTAND